MATPEEKYYDTVNTLLAPVRWAKSLVQTVLLLAIVIVIGLAYPLIMHFNGEPVTLAAYAVPFLTILAIVTFFYAPYYLVFGGIGGLFLFGCLLGIPGFENAIDGISFEWFVFGFLTFGILQRYIRHRVFDPPKEPKPKTLSFVEQLNQDIRREHGDECAMTSETSADKNNALSEHYATLGIGRDATPEEVKQAYRDLTKVWHPDRFDDGDTRLKQRAEEQLKTINDAYAHLQESQSQLSQQPGGATENTSLAGAILEAELFMTAMTAKGTALQTMMLAGLKTEEVAAALQEYSSMCVEGISRVKTLIGRIQREAPESPVADFERLLATMIERQAELERYAAAATASPKVALAPVVQKP